MNTEVTIVIKILGESAVGKTSIFERYINGFFTEQNFSTVGPDFGTKLIDINKQPVKVQVWDLHGGEQFQNIIKCYFRGSHGFLVVFDITKQNSFIKASSLIETIFASDLPDPYFIALVGNKIDIGGERQVSVEEARGLASLYKLHYFETSARTGKGVDDVFCYLATKAFNEFTKNKYIHTNEKEYQDGENNRGCAIA